MNPLDQYFLRITHLIKQNGQPRRAVSHKQKYLEAQEAQQIETFVTLKIVFNGKYEIKLANDSNRNKK